MVFLHLEHDNFDFNFNFNFLQRFRCTSLKDMVFHTNSHGINQIHPSWSRLTELIWLVKSILVWTPLIQWVYFYWDWHLFTPIILTVENKTTVVVWNGKGSGILEELLLIRASMMIAAEDFKHNSLKKLEVDPVISNKNFQYGEAN